MSTIAKEPPTEKVKDMKVEGLNDEDIIDALKPNYSNRDINDAMNQAKQEIPEDNILEELDKIQSTGDEEELIEEAPSPDYEETPMTRTNYPSYGVQSSMSSDQMQEIVEAVVEEKWEDLTSKFGDLTIWKETVNNDLEAVKQEVLRLRERINNLQDVMLGKVTEYSKNINTISTEMKALEQVFQRILQPLTSNIKDLNRVTQELKSRKHHKITQVIHKQKETKAKKKKK